MKIKKLSILLLLVLIFTGCSKEVEEENTLENYAYEESDKTFILENDHIKFTLDPSTTYFRQIKCLYMEFKSSRCS